MRNAGRLLTGGLIAGLALCSSIAARAAGFDCAAATGPVEEIICADPELRKYDSAMTIAYLGAQDRSNQPARIQQSQLAWLRERNACRDAVCVGNAYEARLEALKAVSDKPRGCVVPPTPSSCGLVYVQRAERERQRYMAAARERLAEGFTGEDHNGSIARALKGFEAAETAWKAYLAAECGAVGDFVTTPMGNDYVFRCQEILTKARTVEVWRNFLSGRRYSEPILERGGF